MMKNIQHLIFPNKSFKYLLLLNTFLVQLAFFLTANQILTLEANADVLVIGDGPCYRRYHKKIVKCEINEGCDTKEVDADTYTTVCPAPTNPLTSGSLLSSILNSFTLSASFGGSYLNSESGSTPNGSPMYETGCPVDIQSGNKRMHSIDFMGGGDFPLHVKRDYYSEFMNKNQSDFYAVFGEDWVSNFDHWMYGAGINTFAQNPKRIKKIKTVGNRTYSLNTTTGITRVMETATQEKHHGIWRKRIHKEINRQGVSKTYYYNGPGGKLSRVLHSSGESLWFKYTGSRVSEITVPGGHKIKYEYRNSNSGQPLLTKVHLPTGGHINYNYELTTPVHGPRWWYLAGFGFDGKQRATYTYGVSNLVADPWKVRSSGLVDGTQKTTFSYPGHDRKLTNAKGGVETYTYRAGGYNGIKREATPHADASHNSIATAREDFKAYHSTNARGTDTWVRYNELGEIKAQHIEGITTKYIRDDHGRIVSEANYKTDDYGMYHDPEEQGLPLITRISYRYYADDSAGRGQLQSVTKTDEAGNDSTISYSYLFHSNKLLKQKVVDGPLAGNGDALTFNYDSKGRLSSMSNSKGHTHWYTYNGKSFYHADSHTGPNGLVTKFEHDESGRLIKQRVMTSPERVSTFAYNTDGSLRYQTMPNGQRTSYIYNNVGLLVKEVLYEDPDMNAIDPFVVWASGQTPTFDFWKHYIGYSYDKLGNITNISQTYQKKKVSHIEPPQWDGDMPEVYLIDDSFGAHIAKYKYDVYGNLTGASSAPGDWEEYYYDANGNIKKVVDGLNRNTVNTYTALDQLETSTQNNETVTYNYDDLRRAKSVRDANTNTTEYDNSDSTAEHTESPDSGHTRYNYDAAGNITALYRDNGSTLDYGYDELGRVKTVTPNDSHSSGQTAFYYDQHNTYCSYAKSRLCQVINAGPKGYTETFGYKKDGQVAKIKRSASGISTHEMTFEYDNVGRLHKINYPGGIQIEHAYNIDNEQRTSIVRYNGNTRVALASPTRNLKKIGETKNLGKNKLIFDDRNGGRLKTINANRIGYNAANEITSLSKNSQVFKYDGASRLKSFTSSRFGSQTWTYDKNGNRKTAKQPYWVGTATETYTLEPGTNRVKSISGRNTSYSYDTAGNRTRREGHGDEHDYFYDAFNRLVKVNVNGSQAAEYKYDHLGRRVYKKLASGTVTQYLYNPDHTLAAELDSAGKVKTLYVHLKGRLVGVVRNNTFYDVLIDHLGRPEMVKKGQTVVWQADNLPFDRKVTKDTFGGLNIGYPGQYYDTETGLWNNWHRYYDARTGTYTQSDPIGLEGGMNTYAYVGNNPISYVDPTGLAKDTVTARIEALAARGDIRSLQNLRGGQGLNPTQDALAKQLIGRLNKINHVFGKSQHKLDGFVKSCGNQGKAFDKLNDAFGNAVKGRGNGPIELDVSVNGFNITVRGAVVDGSPKLGTAFIP